MYGIPYDLITPDVFGEKYGGGRIPGGTRGYTWTNWQKWLAPDNDTDTGLALVGVLGMLAGIGLIGYGLSKILR